MEDRRREESEDKLALIFKNGRHSGSGLAFMDGHWVYWHYRDPGPMAGVTRRPKTEFYQLGNGYEKLSWGANGSLHYVLKMPSGKSPLFTFPWKERVPKFLLGYSEDAASSEQETAPSGTETS